MSYYRYITGIYKSYLPQLNRTLRSSSTPRHVPELDTARYARSSSVPPTSFYSNSFLTSAQPFRARAASVPPAPAYTYQRCSPYYKSENSYASDLSYSSSSSSCSTNYSYSNSKRYNDDSHYTDYDGKVIDYMGKLNKDDALRSYVKQSRTSRASSDYYRDTDHRVGFSSKYNYYDAGKHDADYLYKSTGDVLGSWKHYNLSGQTLNERNNRAKSPLVTRELDRYYETKKRSDYIGDISSGPAKDFRFYSYRRVPYFGGSDGYQYMKQKPRKA
ncbi:uncharacterized protein LOC111702976 isoform X2 [Eurytemora carolleeae]|uniref:uncharacterized protein LOC111702976 isoform X2 n=1 Tax=Eurytemora carolleeae TaxID=1294199 RepID=UPI000C75B31C|nr:uncharacterized protein LOC111702976 isoform X2 [Eurytemora carolleeae]|eukprot:XP_023330575.1 uncharacterized protein LOC111702976 isoform X2 [Eurytemora affinis]